VGSLALRGAKTLARARTSETRGGGAALRTTTALPPPSSSHAQRRTAPNKKTSQPPFPSLPLTPTPTPSYPTELSNSLVITTIEDVEPQMIAGKKQTPCQYAVDRTRAVGGKYFSVVPTVHWIGGAGGVQSYVFKDPMGNYHPPTIPMVTRWKVGLQKCFRYAVQSGIQGIQVLNHIDAREHEAWRNTLDFDPTVRYGGWAYEDIVMRPAGDALRTVTKPDTKVWFMVSGEMGKALFRHPKTFIKLLSKYRGPLQAGKRRENVRVGIALHWNKVCGDCFYTPATPDDKAYNATYAQAFRERGKEILAQHDVASIKALFQQADVIGISHYAPVGKDASAIKPFKFDVAADTAAYELAFWGIDLRGLVTGTRRDFLLSEVGLGGAASDGKTPARNAAEAASLPMSGIWAVYNRAQDPWQRQDLREYRRQWSEALLKYLGLPWTRRWPVDGAFLWSTGSYDIAGVHPISTSREGTFADQQIMQSMRKLSTRVRGKRRRSAARRLLLAL
jgi:hypothetical protein